MSSLTSLRPSALSWTPHFDEINALIEEAYASATQILTKHKKALVAISKLLLDQEVIEANEFIELIKKYKAGNVTALKTKTPAKKVVIKKTAVKKTVRKRTVKKKASDDDTTKTPPVSLDQPLDQPT